MADTSIVETCTSTDAFLEGDMAEEVHPDAAWRRVANTHLTDAENATPLLVAVINHIDTNGQGLLKLVFCHSRLIEEVAGAQGYLAVDDGGIGTQVVVYTCVDNLQVEAVLATEHIDTA